MFLVTIQRNAIYWSFSSDNLFKANLGFPILYLHFLSSPSGFSRHALSILVTHNQHKYVKSLLFLLLILLLLRYASLCCVWYAIFIWFQLFFYRHTGLPRLHYRVPIATFLITLVTFSISYPAYIISINKIICELF